MGCNYFCETFPNVEYVIFFDDIEPKIKKNTKVITDIRYFRDSTKTAYNLCRTHKNIEFYTINRNKDNFQTGDSKLNFCVHTPSMALNWAYKKGFKNVVIAGIDLIPNTPHFDKNYTKGVKYPEFNENSIINARKHLEQVASRYLKIYQLNPNSDMELEKITIKDLLNDAAT